MQKRFTRMILAMVTAAALLLTVFTGCDRRGDVMDGSDMFLDISEESPASSVDSVSVVTESAVSESVLPEASGGETGQVLYFNTTDLDDNPVSLETYAGAKLFMVNFWEPWCGPCISELPALEQLYENYKDQGLVILGVYSDPDMLEEAMQLRTDNGLTYPILHHSADFRQFPILYVPTTLFADGAGNVLTEEPYIGSRSYEDWEQIVLEQLAAVNGE